MSVVSIMSAMAVQYPFWGGHRLLSIFSHIACVVGTLRRAIQCAVTESSFVDVAQHTIPCR